MVSTGATKVAKMSSLTSSSGATADLNAASQTSLDIKNNGSNVQGTINDNRSILKQDVPKAVETELQSEPVAQVQQPISAAELKPHQQRNIPNENGGATPTSNESAVHQKLTNVNKTQQQQVNANNNYSGLNLNMTASEMRELIASRKKFDPKKAQMNIRQKYEIIQQM